MFLETFEEYKQHNVNKLNDMDERIREVIELGLKNKERDDRLYAIDIEITKLAAEIV